MTYFKAFFIRLKVKSAVFFSLPFALGIGLYFRSTFLFIAWTCILSLCLISIRNFIVFIQKKKKSGVLCTLCGAESCCLLYPKKNKKVEKLGSFACSSFDHGTYPNIYYCPDCKNAFLERISTIEINVLKKESQDLYEAVIDESYLENINSRHLTYRDFLKSHHQYFNGLQVLEVGSYYGAFYDEVKDLVGSYTGIEPSVHAAQYMKNKGVDIVQGTIEYLHQKVALDPTYLERFDTIVLFDVIEHLPDPIGSLRALNALLKPNGTILFSTINIESTFSILLGPWWPWFMDMHYFYFSDRGYQNMLFRTGFVQKKHEHFPYIVSSHYFLLKVLNLLGIKIKKIWNWIPEFNLPIKLGDTVMIIGRKTTI